MTARIRSERPAFDLHHPRRVERTRAEAHAIGRSAHALTTPTGLAVGPDPEDGPDGR